RESSLLALLIVCCVVTWAITGSSKFAILPSPTDAEVRVMDIFKDVQVTHSAHDINGLLSTSDLRDFISSEWCISLPFWVCLLAEKSPTCAQVCKNSLAAVIRDKVWKGELHNVDSPRPTRVID